MNLFVKLVNWWNNVEKPRYKKFALGWNKDPLDARDKIFGDSGVIDVSVIPLSYDMRSFFPPIRSQGQLGSCTAFALTGAFEAMMKKEALADFEPSELFLYYIERALEGNTNVDAGAYIRDGIKSLNSLGVCDSMYWPYDITKYTWKPSSTAYDNALKNKLINYQRVFNNRPELIRLALSQNMPIVLGFTVYSSFYTIGTSGIMPMPARDANGTITESIAGGHAICVVGYMQINGKNYYICRNSWSDWWGDKGYFYMPEAFIIDTNMCSDVWALSFVS